MDERGLLLEQIYKEAREEVVVGRPVMELPASQVMCDDKGRIFVDLRAVIDSMQLFVSKSNPTD